MGATILISVIVPVYNGAQHLTACIESVLGQSFRNLELILVDDGSTDESPALCDRAAAADARVRVYHRGNSGAIASRAFGAQAAKGQYLMFLDCDDTLDTEMLTAMAGRLLFDGTKEIVCCNYVIDREWNDTHERKKSAAAPGVYERAALRENIQAKIIGEEERTLILSMCMKLFSRDLVLDNLAYCDRRVRMGDDVCLTVPAVLDAERVVVMQDAYYYHYRFLATSLVHAYDPGFYDNIRLVREILQRIFREKGREELLPLAEKEWVYFIFLTLKNEIRRQDAPAKDVVHRIEMLCREEDSPQLIQRVPAPRDHANRLLAFLMRHPNRLVIHIVREIFLLQLRRNRAAS